MKNTLHTHGPWTHTPSREHSNPDTTRRDIVAESQFGPAFIAGDVSQSDASLIASAPDLLSAVDSCLEIMIRAIGERLPIQQGTECEETDWQTAIRNAREALRKAKGEA